MNFESLWIGWITITGRKCPKKSAEKAFIATMKLTTSEAVLARLNQRWTEEWCKYREVKYIPHMSTWLRAEDWSETESACDDKEPALDFNVKVQHLCEVCEEASHWWTCEEDDCGHTRELACPEFVKARRR